MKKQNVKITLLASLLTGLLSQGAMAATPASGQGTTIYLSADVSKTSCSVTPIGSGGAPGGVSLQDMGSFNKSDLVLNAKTWFGGAQYHLTPSTTAPLILTISDCTGDDLAQAGELKMEVRGPRAFDANTLATADDLFGDPVNDRGYGFALGYAITDNSAGSAAANNELASATGNILPSEGGIAIYKAKVTPNSGDVNDINISVKVVPQIAAWAASDANIMDGQLDSNVVFQVAMN